MQLKHFLQFNDFSREEFEYLFERTRWIKNKFKQYQRYWPLEDRTLAMIFDKNSTRTRLSFEAGMDQMGGRRRESRAEMQVDRLLHRRPHLAGMSAGQEPGQGGCFGFNLQAGRAFF